MELSGYFLIGQIFLPAFPEYFTAFIRQKRHRFFYQMMKFLQLQFRIIVLHNLHTLHFFQINRNLLVPDIGKRLIACRLEQIGFQGKRALQRGPLVYCLEETDNAKDFADLALTPTSSFEVKDEPDNLGGIRSIKAISNGQTLHFIPYYAWDNRKAGKMKVWIDYQE